MITWQYLAGFIDGEGSIRVYGHKRQVARYEPRISVAQAGLNGRLLLLEIQSFLEANNIKSGVYGGGRRDHPKHSPCWHLILSANLDNIERFLSLIIPHLVVKRVEAQDTLRFIRQFRLPKLVKTILYKEFQNRPETNKLRSISLKATWRLRKAC